MLATVESKNQAVSKLEALIERGRSRAANVIDHVMRNQPTDRLARGEALQFRAADNLPEILMTVRNYRHRPKAIPQTDPQSAMSYATCVYLGSYYDLQMRGGGCVIPHSAARSAAQTHPRNAPERPLSPCIHLYFTTTYTKLGRFVIDRSSVQVRSSAPDFQ